MASARSVILGPGLLLLCEIEEEILGSIHTEACREKKAYSTGRFEENLVREGSCYLLYD